MYIVRAMLISVIIVLLAFVAFSYFSGTSSWRYPHDTSAVGTTGTSAQESAREKTLREDIFQCHFRSLVKFQPASYYGAEHAIAGAQCSHAAVERGHGLGTRR